MKDQNLKTKLAQLLELGKRQMAHDAIVPAGFQEPTAYRERLPAVNGQLSLTRDYLPGLVSSDGRIYRTPNASTAAEEVQLSTALVQHSRVARAGSLVIPYSGNIQGIPTGKKGDMAVVSRPGQFVTVDPALFAAADEVTGDIALSALPSHEAQIDMDASVSRAVRFEVTRSDQKRKGMDQLSSEIMTAIALGIGRLVDRELCAAIRAAMGATPASFTLATAAAAGLRFEELRALVGSAASGASVENGILRAGGVQAELTADMVETTVGAWDRSAVAVSDDISLLIERRDTSGKLAVTCWLEVLPLVPQPGMFWSL